MKYERKYCAGLPAATCYFFTQFGEYLSERVILAEGVVTDCTDRFRLSITVKKAEESREIVRVIEIGVKLEEQCDYFLLKGLLAI